VFLGGVRAGIWTDVAQWFIYIGGAIVALYYLADLLPQQLSYYFTQASKDGKLSLFQFGAVEGQSFFGTALTLPASVLGGMFLSMASHGTDQLIVQRILATRNIRNGQRAIILSGFLVTFQFALFLVVGTLLYYFYGAAEFSSNEVFAQFIIDHIPTGFTGLIIAGIFAAAMSTLSGSISSLSSATVMDIFLPLSKRSWTEAQKLVLSRRISIGWAILLVLAACMFIQTPKTVIELALSIASYTYGGLLGLFLLGRLFKHVSNRAAFVGFIAGITGMTGIVLFTDIAWTWYTLIGSLITIAFGLLLQLFTKKG
jgi:solute:Na+ symporter, SSS family